MTGTSKFFMLTTSTTEPGTFRLSWFPSRGSPIVIDGIPRDALAELRNEACLELRDSESAACQLEVLRSAVDTLVREIHELAGRADRIRAGKP